MSHTHDRTTNRPAPTNVWEQIMQNVQDRWAVEFLPMKANNTAMIAHVLAEAQVVNGNRQWDELYPICVDSTNDYAVPEFELRYGNGGDAVYMEIRYGYQLAWAAGIAADFDRGLFDECTVTVPPKATIVGIARNGQRVGFLMDGTIQVQENA